MPRPTPVFAVCSGNVFNAHISASIEVNSSFSYSNGVIFIFIRGKFALYICENPGR